VEKGLLTAETVLSVLLVEGKRLVDVSPKLPV